MPAARWFGGDDAGRRMGIVVVRPDVAKAEAVLSDRARVTIQLHRTPRLGRNRVGALVYTRDLDLHRLDLRDAAGVSLDAHP